VRSLCDFSPFRYGGFTSTRLLPVLPFEQFLPLATRASGKQNSIVFVQNVKQFATGFLPKIAAVADLVLPSPLMIYNDIFF